MIKVYLAISWCKPKDYMDKRYNITPSVEYVDKIYPDVFWPEVGFEMKEMWKFDPEYVPHLYISEKIKPIFEEHFSDSGYFVGEVIECYSRPQEGRVIKGYYKWVVKNIVQCMKKDQGNQRYYTSEMIESDIFAMCFEENLMLEGYMFSDKAIKFLLGDGFYSSKFYKYEIYPEGEYDD